jgi:hypothetical protein
MIALNEMPSMISETRQPFARRHNSSCVYYGIRGNTRSKYMWDKSCVLDGPGMGITRIGPGYAMPLGADPEVAGVIAVQQAINAAATKLGMGTGPQGGLFVQRNYELAQQVAREATKPGKLRDLLSAAPNGSAALNILELITRHTFEETDSMVDSANLVANVASAFTLVATVAPSGMSTTAKVVIGVGVAALIGGVALMSMGKTMTSRNLQGARRRRKL